jgi:hypothetical protein
MRRRLAGGSWVWPCTWHWQRALHSAILPRKADPGDDFSAAWSWPMGHTHRHRHRIGMPGRAGDVMPRIGLLGSYGGLDTGGETRHSLLAAIADFVVHGHEPDILFVPVARIDVRRSHAVVATRWQRIGRGSCTGRTDLVRCSA